MNENNILEIKDLSVIYKTDLETVKAVNGINIAIKKKSTFGLVGETGAGKTTTARSIIRLLPSVGHVTSGTIEFEDRNLLELPEAEMRLFRGDKIAMVFQDPMTSLNPVMSVGDQIAETIKIHNPELDKAEVGRRVEATLAMVGILPSRKVEYPHQFSGGMKQRVIIAMALACEPQLLIADEPTTALDVTIQAQVLMMIKDLRDRLGTSMLMITHDLGIVAKICDDVGIMYAGEIVEAGTVQDIFEGKNHHPYTEGLFGSIPNLKSKAKRLNAIPGLMPDPTDLPEGCVFAERCKYAMELCHKVHPSVATSGTHQLCCHLFNADGSRKEKNHE
ncbi:MAG: ABC transporter ATP-binding protein [Christensenellaceae bacterium]|jgi:peptide/nickel transport system ATP-binding protein|nr:ABC transporter ATP-binding protein [Christensenellaceae bacterium]PWM62032.1 MAG: dipeptide/oligopeptide/nickel ABC transporter ATP-binding protein [Clostridia bacterium]